MLRKRILPRVSLSDALILGGVAVVLALAVYLVYRHSHTTPPSHRAQPGTHHAQTPPAPTTPSVQPSASPGANRALPPTITIAGGLKEIRGVQYGPNPAQVMDIFLPASASRPTPGVILVHGGGFTGGDKSSLFPEAKGVASVGWAGITINYRLNGYPQSNDDVIAAATWLHDHAQELHIDPNRLGLLGTSAGGTLVAEAATVAHQRNLDLGIRAVVSWSGPMDLATFDQTATQAAFRALNSFVHCPISRCSAEWAAASPSAHVTSGDPPMYLFNSTCEAIPYSQATSMVSQLKSHGDTVQLQTITGKLHALQYASQAYAPSVQWLARYLGPFHGALPPVPSNTGGLPANIAC